MGTQSLESRNQPEDDASQNGDAEGVEENVAIEGDLFGAWQAVRQSGNQDAHAPLCQEETDAAAGDAEKNALGEQLANHSGGTSSQRGAYGKFARTARRAGKKKVGDVGAGD